VATNGGTIVRSNQIHGTIDNNVPLNIPPYTLPTTLPLTTTFPNQHSRQCHDHSSGRGFGRYANALPPFSLTGNLTVNAIGGAETFVALHVTGDITGKITVNPKVHLQVYFDGNVSVKARD